MKYKDGMMKYKDEYVEWFDYNIRVSGSWLKTINLEDATAMAWEAAINLVTNQSGKAEIRGEGTGIPALDLLETRLQAGCQIEKCDMGWCLFDKEGECVCYGTSIRQMLVNLIFTDC